jgi:hypothetical protein
MRELFTVCISAKAEDIGTARTLSLEWMHTQGGHAQTVETMLPTPLSPSGQNPPTHHLCSMGLTKEQYAHMLGFIIDHKVPVVADLIGPQAEDSHEAIAPNREKWLSAKNLKVIDA